MVSIAESGVAGGAATGSQETGAQAPVAGAPGTGPIGDGAVAPSRAGGTGAEAEDGGVDHPGVLGAAGADALVVSPAITAGAEGAGGGGEATGTEAIGAPAVAGTPGADPNWAGIRDRSGSGADRCVACGWATGGVEVACTPLWASACWYSRSACRTAIVWLSTGMPRDWASATRIRAVAMALSVAASRQRWDESRLAARMATADTSSKRRMPMLPSTMPMRVVTPTPSTVWAWRFTTLAK
ncbi:hypothetical protein ACFPRL_23875 [Pseudoclavibacter helvolus]